jgi:pyridinium-3,5-bisthiocarboxylic acid mononucleotide nickel chelatase
VPGRGHRLKMLRLLEHADAELQKLVGPMLNEGVSPGDRERAKPMHAHRLLCSFADISWYHNSATTRRPSSDTAGIRICLAGQHCTTPLEGFVKVAFFDPFSGASGDMTLGSLVDAGLPLEHLASELGKLRLGGFRIRSERAGQHGIHGTRVIVDVTGDDHHHRDWATIRAIIEDSDLQSPVKTAALAIFERLAKAEAKIHAADLDHVHFHEVGGVDAIVDICGTAIGLSLLGIEAVYAGAPQLGSGFATSAHGIIPVPAPATLELIADAEAPTAKPLPIMLDHPAELLTPTGAAILTTLATFTLPSFAPSAIGYGFGQKELPWPNALRVWIGEMQDEDADDGEVMIETNIDDMSPQFYEMLTERLFAAGALDVWTASISMKKGRPATKVTVLAPTSRRVQLEHVLMRNSTTLGTRSWNVDRTKAGRDSASVTTRWGDVPVKLRVLGGRVADAQPEYDVVARLAREFDQPIREVWNEAHRLGESFVGQLRNP